MTVTFLLVRHAAHDDVGRYLAGRRPGVRLGVEGRAQAARLGARMRRERFGRILASPRERTQETARAVAEAAGIDTVETAAALDEIDFGRWSGHDFETLDEDPDWRRWNEDRGHAATPAGETMEHVRFRIVSVMERLQAEGAAGAVVLVSHADVIKAAVCDVLGLPLDRIDRFDIAPASITTVVAGAWGAKLIGLNEVVA
ncbi:histidine phosphatase family protein [Prosthecomicrobium pneumaticum]|uniref:Broad specificity phosphatase PhoE n=1 Tax=Prosthecomicrobium pneumaticum TaxID=81895 RepID=A0A7W9CTG1_9HYPH|nr:broad specificity phosphatase PhoE [Prosthecomicrobium pneumaticum]